MISEPVLAELEDVVGREVLLDLVTTYADDAKQLMAAIRKGFGDRDATAIARASHTLKSTSETLGAISVGATCAELERLGRGGEVPSEELVDRLDAELAVARTALAERMARP